MNVDNKLEFFKKINKLKRTIRAGWPLHGVKNGESVADHIFQVTFMAMVLSDKVDVDQNKSMKMALIHDIGESIIGDVITERGGQNLPNLEQKIQSERTAVKSILETAGASEFIELFDEFVENQTPEAKFVRQLDKLETAIQACEYEKSDNLDLSEFYINARKHVSDPTLLKLLEYVIQDK